MTDKALIVAVSVHRGNTLKVARAMAEVLGAEIRSPEEVDPRSLAEYDVVGFGSGVYGQAIHPRLAGFVQGLPHVTGRRAFVFTTSGMGHEQHRPWQPRLEDVLGAKGYEVVGSFACRGVDAWFPLSLLGGGLNKRHPDAYDLSHAHEFAVSVVGVPVA